MPTFSVESSAIFPYLSDESSAFSGHAERVYFPAAADEVASVLGEATGTGTGVTISGGGTSLTGARVPTTGGWILATDRLTEPPPPLEAGSWVRLSTGESAIYLDKEQKRARVPAGLRLNELDALVKPHGLFYPPTLTETSAMIGGTIATNASGARSFHYGSTRDWVDALTVVTADGSTLRLRRGEHIAQSNRLQLKDEVALPDLRHPSGVKNAAGYFLDPEMDAVDLFVGGEGTLGVVTDAEVRLSDRPANAVTLVVYLDDRNRALDFADSVRSGAFAPWTALALEYFDRNSLDFMREAQPGIPKASAAVLVEIDPLEADLPWFATDGVAGRWQSTIAEIDPVDVWAILPDESEQIREWRHSLPDRVNDYVRTRRGKLGTDFAVPPHAFRELVREYDTASSQGIHSVLFGHLGEFHLHLNFLVEDAAQMERAKEIYMALAEKSVSLGGTVSAEHGVGKKQIWMNNGQTEPYLQLMYGDSGMTAMANLKRQLDPSWILNRDTMIPWAG